ncbi:sensor histidine kinase [Rubrivirga sp.]|uniref:sensor histidine kinase n=1 Tax=Rubrivirga sp. TaxID=1885344 RepID=UPI003C728069
MASALHRISSRLGSAFAVHPNGPTPVALEVEAELAARTRRRSRIIAWLGFLTAFPLLYIDHWVPYRAGVWDVEVHHEGYLVWRLATIVTLGGWLWWDHRSPNGGSEDLRLANVFSALAVVLGAWFGLWFGSEPSAYPMYSFLLLMVGVMLQPPSSWLTWAYVLAPVITLGGALLHGTDFDYVASWTSAYVMPTIMIIMVHRVVYRQAYATLESRHLLTRANADLEDALGELRDTQGLLLDAERQTERLRISRDLHDSVGAQLSNLIAGVELARLEQRASGADSSSRTLDVIEGDARDAMGLLRETVWALSGTPISISELARQLQRFARDSTRAAAPSATVRVEGDRDQRLDSTAALHLLRIGQEAVQNAVKHSGGDRIEVVLEAGDGRVVLEVTDDGAFQRQTPVSGDGAPSGFGMHTMRERAEALGADLEVATESGTAIRVEVAASVLEV